MIKNTLHQQLIHALSAIRLRRSQNNSGLQRVINCLNEPDTKIPDNDYSNVMNFLIMIIQEMPEIKTASQNGSFIELCLICDKYVSAKESSSKTKLSGKH